MLHRGHKSTVEFFRLSSVRPPFLFGCFSCLFCAFGNPSEESGGTYRRDDLPHSRQICPVFDCSDNAEAVKRGTNRRQAQSRRSCSSCQCLHLPSPYPAGFFAPLGSGLHLLKISYICLLSYRKTGRPAFVPSYIGPTSPSKSGAPCNSRRQTSFLKIPRVSCFFRSSETSQNSAQPLSVTTL